MDENADQSSRGQDARFPVSSFYEVMDARTYVRTKTKIVALCVLKGKYGKELKLYQWEWRGEQKGWKVGLANLRVEGLNLKRLAEDAELLAKEHGIELKWD
jgi:hypothetical protein